MADQWVRYFSVTDAQRHSKGFTVYKVTSTVFPLNTPEAKTEVVVWKRYKEFQKLHQDLKNRHEKLCIKDQFPSFSKPRLFGRFDQTVIEERRSAAQELLDFIANHPSLFMSQSCVKFFERSQKMLLNNEISQGTLNPQVTTSEGDTKYNILGFTSRSPSPSTLTDTDSVGSFQLQEESTDVGSNASHGSRGIADKEDTSVRNNHHAQGKNTLMNQPAIASGAESNEIFVTYPETEVNVEAKSLPNLMENSTSGLIGGINESSLVIDYITEAGFHISQAVECEANSQFEQAFLSYKTAISFLLNGLQDDTSEDRKAFVQRKASQYLMRAEQIFHDHLEASHHQLTPPKAPRLEERRITQNLRSLEAPISDLQFFKVLGIIPPLILALNTQNNTPYVVKVLHKSSCPVDRRTKPIVPCNVPFMSHLHSYIENERAVFLVLEQAVGGRLWDHISPYFEYRQGLENSKEAFVEFVAECTKESKEPICQENSASQQIDSNRHPKEEKGLDHHTQTIEEVSFTVSQETENLESGHDLIVSQLNNTVSYTDHQEVSNVEAQVSSLQIHQNPSDVFPTEENSDGDVEIILKNSQKLLDSVNKTLTKSEETTKALLHLEVPIINEVLLINQVKDNSAFKTKTHKHSESSLSQTTTSQQACKERYGRDHKRPSNRERNPSLSRNSRSRTRFSCDDMFEGRARALSKSLDREALLKTDPRVDQPSCLGLPLSTVRLWASQLLLALDALHCWGVIIGDLRPDNLLLGKGFNLVLTYQCQWVCVDRVINSVAIEQMYAAPEICSFHQVITAAVDWWSYGVILFELLSGETFYSCHPGGFHSFSSLYIPHNVPDEGANLLRQLLRFEPQSRLGVGRHGVAKLKAHSFFQGIEWSQILLMSASV